MRKAPNHNVKLGRESYHNSKERDEIRIQREVITTRLGTVAGWLSIGRTPRYCGQTGKELRDAQV